MSSIWREWYFVHCNKPQVSDSNVEKRYALRSRLAAAMYCTNASVNERSNSRRRKSTPDVTIREAEVQRLGNRQDKQES